MTRDVSDAGVFVECDAGAAIPLYRLVHLQVERSTKLAEALPMRLREGRVLSAVWRVAPCRKSTGTPSGYALRFLVDPPAAAVRRRTTSRSQMPTPAMAGERITNDECTGVLGYCGSGDGYSLLD